MNKNFRPSYFESLAAVRGEIDARLEMAKAELADVEFFADSFKSFKSGVNYGQQVRESAPLATLKGKSTRKFFHAIVDRTCAGNYELTSYIL